MAQENRPKNYLQRVALHMALRVVGAVTPSQQVNAALNQLFAMSIGDRHPATLSQQEANKSWVFAANRRIAGRAVAADPIMELNQRQNGKMNTVQAVYDHPFMDLLGQPNLDQSRTVLHWQQIVQLNTAGRCYVLVEPTSVRISGNTVSPWGGSTGGEDRRVLTSLSRMVLLEPDRVRPYSAVGRRAAAFEYFDLYGGHGIYPAAPVTYAQREEWKQNPAPFVVRIFIPSPDSWNGQSVTEAASWAINTTFGLSQMWGNQLKNGLHAGLIFYLKKAGMSEVDRFEKAVTLIKAGIGKAGEPLVLPENTVSVEKSPMSMADMQFEALGAYSRQETLSVLGASDDTVGLSSHGSRASADTAERVLALSTIDPMNSLIADAYNSCILPLYPGQSRSSWYTIRYTSAAAADEVVQTQVLTVRAGGSIITPNEARAEIGKPPLPDGDKLREPKGVASPPNDGSGGDSGGGGFGNNLSAEGAISQASNKVSGGGDQGDLAGKQAGSKASQPSEMPQLQRSRRRERECGCANHGRKRVRYAIHPDHPLAVLHNADARAAKFKTLDTSRRVAEAKLRDAIAPVFGAWKQHTGATSARGARVDGAAVMADTAVWVQAFQDAYRPWAADWTQQVVTRVLSDYGLTDSEIANVQGDKALEGKLEAFATSRASAFATQITDTQQTLIADANADADAQDLDDDATAAMVAGTFPDESDPRLRMMGATEGSIATGLATFAGAEAIQDFNDTGNDDGSAPGDDADNPDVGLMWLSIRDGKVRASHREADGQVVPLGDLFHLDGCDMQYPGDDTNCGDESELINCRCSAIVTDVTHSEGWENQDQSWKNGSRRTKTSR